ncbi:putative Mg2+ transporter-C (MgtC) family protein [Novosphingobium sp. PhB57]|uniref:MgtC/SapB family protein n=1 Tax=Novosphingobium sp. PhB57 TaxID=2485107 RepID=UPI00104D9799|nr:MgtC/SapB family protein [Novosphingobium sp. PhB57]TCU61906.1 putative Mg2+ transporter-C (MgtC) family protein [Novosphingobium sp. PhB57]
MELNPAIPLHAIDSEVLLRLGIAAVVGLLLGLDREWHGHPAGLRTHGLVCVAAATMTTSIIALYFQLDGPRMDPLRIFEATGAFVGFIGAGLIVFSRGRLRNLTTAAHMWLTAIIGIACGAGQWPLVAIGMLVSLVMVTALHFVEARWDRRHPSPGKER